MSDEKKYVSLYLPVSSSSVENSVFDSSSDEDSDSYSEELLNYYEKIENFIKDTKALIKDTNNNECNSKYFSMILSCLQNYYDITKDEAILAEIKLYKGILENNINQKQENHGEENNVYQILDIIKDWAKIKAIESNTELVDIDINYKYEMTNRLGFKKEEKFKTKIDKFEILAVTDKQDEKYLASWEKKIIKNESSKNKEFYLQSQINKGYTYELNYGLVINEGKKGRIGVIKLFPDLEIDVGLIKNNKVKEEEIDSKEKVILKANHKAIYSIQTWAVPTERMFKIPIQLAGKIPISFKDKVTYENNKLTKAENSKRLVFIPIVDIFKNLLDLEKLPRKLDIKFENNNVVCILTGKYILEKYSIEIVTKLQKLLPSIQPKTTHTSTYTPKQVVVNTPAISTNHILTKTIAENISQEIFENKDILFRLKILMESAYADTKDDLGEEIAEIIKHFKNSDAQEYIVWYLQRYSRHNNNIEEAYNNHYIDIFIYEKEKIKANNTNKFYNINEINQDKRFETTDENLNDKLTIMGKTIDLKKISEEIINNWATPTRATEAKLANNINNDVTVKITTDTFFKHNLLPALFSNTKQTEDKSNANIINNNIPNLKQ